MFSPSVCVGEQVYSEQYKRYNLIRGHHCGLVVRTAVGTALVYSAHSGFIYRDSTCVLRVLEYQRTAQPAGQSAAGVYSSLHNTIIFTKILDIRKIFCENKI